MFVYADNAATTMLTPMVREAIRPWQEDNWGNPSSLYGFAREAKKAIEKAREEIAEVMGAQPGEIFFTSGGTESDNWAIRGIYESRAAKGRHIITSAIEHHATLHTVEYLETLGAEVTTLSVDKDGIVSVDEFEAALRDDTVLVTIMAANNEIGAIQPIAAMAAEARVRGIAFHTDAVQAVGHIPVNVSEWQVDLLSASAHKFHGPKGVGFLYVKRGSKLPPSLWGGGHERGLRSGTENVPGIVGMAAALTDAAKNMNAQARTTAELRDHLIQRVLSEIPYSFLTGAEGIVPQADDFGKRLPGIASFIFEAVEGESLVLGLDAAGVCASSGSACSSGTLDPSHVLLALGLPHEVAHGSVRISLSHLNTRQEVDHIANSLAKVIATRREMSPLWENGKPTERFWQTDESGNIVR